MTDPEQILAAVDSPVTVTLTRDAIAELFRRLELIDRQGQAAFVGNYVNAKAIFINTDAIVKILTSGDETQRLTAYNEAMETRRAREAAAKLRDS